MFYCKVGKDRTGLMAMLLLTIAGVTEDRILADYTLCAPAVLVGLGLAVVVAAVQYFGRICTTHPCERLLKCREGQLWMVGSRSICVNILATLELRANRRGSEGRAGCCEEAGALGSGH
jgi:Tyrosine phosphatase family